MVWISKGVSYCASVGTLADGAPLPAIHTVHGRQEGRFARTRSTYNADPRKPVQVKANVTNGGIWSVILLAASSFYCCGEPVRLLQSFLGLSESEM